MLNLSNSSTTTQLDRHTRQIIVEHGKGMHNGLHRGKSGVAIQNDGDGIRTRLTGHLGAACLSTSEQLPVMVNGQPISMGYILYIAMEKRDAARDRAVTSCQA